eukprot:4206734-Ditylum_brightwellii.AAC.1
MVLLKEWCTYLSKGEIQQNTPMRGVELCKSPHVQELVSHVVVLPNDDDVNDTAVVAVAETLPSAIPATVTITTMTE